jgi:pimeloyl-ACP methyl ester carboxylesterase
VIGLTGVCLGLVGAGALMLPVCIHGEVLIDVCGIHVSCMMLKVAFTFVVVLVVIYLGICLLAYVFQERLIFLPDRLDKNYRFNFDSPCEEVFVKASDGTRLHGLLFKAEHSKGIIFYLHGNAGALDSWGDVASTYLRLHYDVFLLDYRGYGKSEGSITNEAQLTDDVQQAYAHLLSSYREQDVIVLGYSLGSGLAAKIASANHPRMLIMQAPYFSLTDMMKHSFSFLPTFLLKYKLVTHEVLQQCKMPVIMIHGDRDEVIPYAQSLKLEQLLKPGDTLITLRGVGHNGMTGQPQYIGAIERILGDTR